MSSSTKRLKPYLKYLEELGAELDEVTMAGSGHFRMRVTYGGKTKTVIVSYSPSDRRSFLNWKSDMRRIVGEMRHG